MSDIDDFFTDATDEMLGVHLPPDDFYKGLDEDNSLAFSSIYLKTLVPLFYLWDYNVTGLSPTERLNVFYLSTALDRGQIFEALSKVNDPDIRQKLSLSWAFSFTHNIADFFEGIQDGAITERVIVEQMEALKKRIEAERETKNEPRTLQDYTQELVAEMFKKFKKINEGDK